MLLQIWTINKKANSKTIRCTFICTFNWFLSSIWISV